MTRCTDLLDPWSFFAAVFSNFCSLPFFVSQTFLPLIPRGGKIINISSGAGSICGGISGYAPLYSASKTAENALTLHLAQALKARGIAVNLVCPGWVRTDMGGPGAARPVEKGAETPVWLATEAPGNLTGKFFRDKKETRLWCDVQRNINDLGLMSRKMRKE